MSHLYRRPKKDGIYWLCYYDNGEAHYISLKTKDHSTAKYLQSKHDKEVHEGKYVNYDPNPGCENLLNEYLEASQHRKTAKTNKNDETRIREFLKWAGATKINQITEKKLQDYTNYRINHDKLALTSANRIIATIKAWLNFAVRRKIIFENPIKYFQNYKPGEKHPKFLPIDEVNKLIEAAQGNRLYYPILTALYTGMRVEEIYHLEWPDIDFTNGHVTVKHTSGFITKSKKERTVPLTDKLKIILLPLRKASGKCFDPTNHKHAFPKIVEAAGLNKVGFHHFRHTYASHLAMAGVDLYTIAQLLGHSDIKVTEQYAYLTKDHKKAAVEKLPY